jgi:hypothetical protein
LVKNETLDPDELSIIPEAPIDLEIETDPPSKLEIQKAIKDLKTWHIPIKCRIY